MTTTTNTIVRIATWLAGATAVVVALLLPFDNYLASYHYTVGNLEAEAEINSRIISGIINANPEQWRFEEMRLEEILAHRPRSGEKELRRIVDLNGTVVVQSDDHLASPLVVRSYDLKDSGVTVARIEISRSLRPLLVHGALNLLLGCCLGLVVFFAMRILPFRAVIRAEELLAREQRFSHILLDNLADGVVACDENGNLNLFNRTAREWHGMAPTGLPPEQWSGQYGLVEPDGDAPLPMAAIPLLRAFRGEHVRNAPFKIVMSGQPPRDILSSGDPLSDANNRQVGAVVIMRDITEQRQMVKALVAAETKYRNLLESVQLVAVMLDCTGAITFCNNYFLELTGWSRDEVFGKNFFDLFTPEDVRDTVKAVYESSIARKELSHYERAIMTRNGVRRLIVWNNSFLWDSDGNINGVATIGTDITEKKHLEEQLRQSQKMEAIGTLAGGIAHDFNNVLTVIMGYAYLIVEGDKGDDVKGMAQEIVSSVKRAEEMTKNLLAFSRKQTLELIPVDLNEIIQGLAKSLPRLIREDVEIRVELSDRPLPAMADKWQLEQVLINLGVNARDAMPTGGVLAITTDEIDVSGDDIERYGVAAPGRYGLIMVTDTGCGMDTMTRERIFEPFFTTKEVGRGTGLGLSMVYGAVNKHNGHITVYSEPGQGTTFKIYLPLLESLEQDQPDVSEEVLPNGSETVLLVEDDETIRRMTRQLLENHGYHVLEAVDGEEAVSVFRENRDAVQLVLTDVIMPRKNGREALEEMRRIRPGVPAIFMSGYSADVMTRRWIVKEKVNYLTKPLKPAQLLKTMRDILSL